jgi:hypothetical protein
MIPGLKSCLVTFSAISLFLLTGCGGSVAPLAPSNPIKPGCATSVAAPTAPNQWTWMSGNSTPYQPGIYGTQGVASAANTPGARVYPVSWTDTCGNFWLFGGYGIDSTNVQGDLNDLWEYSAGRWTWISGSNLTEQSGVYGTLGVAAATNVPGARWMAVSWIDPQGNFWLFGGLGKDSAGNRGYLNDLWRYANGQWTWMSGSNLIAVVGANQPGIYGTRGVAAPTNMPAARVDANSWSDASGNLWLFGGLGEDSAATTGILSDLWKFSNGEWTWVAGSNLANQYGVYGTLGTPAAANTPGARTNAVTWTDLSGNLWLFGGQGNDSGLDTCPSPCNLNDLWKFSEGQWTWIGGSNLDNQPGAYGLQTYASPGNHPGARWGSYSWTDSAGNFWLFGGNGMDSSTAPEVYGDLNDLWEYTNGQWIWVSGSNKALLFTGTYGAKGVPAATNIPGVRDSGASWIDTSGNLWLFGGGDYFSIPLPNGGKLNDLWEYQTWGASGPPTQPPPTTYTIGGTISGLSGSIVLQDDDTDSLTLTANGAFTFKTPITPGSAYAATILAQPANQYCTIANATGIVTAAVTNIQITCTAITGRNEWTWIAGANTNDQPGIYGTLGTPAATNTPGARNSASTWTDSAGNLWLFGGNYGAFGNGLIGPGGQETLIYTDYNDLWKFSKGEWTWMSGANTLLQSNSEPGVYGTKGVAASTNQPAARHTAATWTDASGNFWLFGGTGYDSAGAQGYLNDLWQFSNGQWTWIAGSNLANQPGSYSATPAPANTPGARSNAVTWTDATGTLWLFGGFGYDSTSAACYHIFQKQCLLNDLWKFSNGQWTWVSGANTVNQQGTYGALGVPAATNVPGARFYAVTWIDNSGALWLFGGNGIDSTGTTGPLNDLWKFANGEWTWIAGANIINQPGTYGTQGTPAATNTPGARGYAVSWTDATGNFWLLGGYGLASATSAGDLNDLWKFSNGQWTWVSGSNQANQLGTYGTQGIPYPANIPGARDSAANWIDPAGNLWLFGGETAGQNLNDLWQYQP